MWSHELEHGDIPRSDSLPKVTESVDGEEGAGGRWEVSASGVRSFLVRLYRITLKKAVDEEKVELSRRLRQDK